MTAHAARAAETGVVEIRPWNSIVLSKLNPRRHFDDEEIEGLADSIFAKGVLQNLIVRPHPAELELLEVGSGERRWRAIGRLVGAGRVGDEYPVPVRVIEMTDVELLELAMTENLQRRDMTALEEADGFALLIEMGRTADTIAANTGYRPRLIQQRLALHHRLAPEVRNALDLDAINLGQAQAFTLGDKERQAELLAAVVQSPARYDAAEIRRLLTERYIPMSRAIFPRERYKGALRRDLFVDEQYAEDRTEFARLQAEGADEHRAELAATWSWAELRRGGQVDLWNFGRDESPAKAGAIVHLRDDLRVEIHTGLVRKAELPVARTNAPYSAPASSTASRPAESAAAAAAADPAPPSSSSSSSAGLLSRAAGRVAAFTKAHLAWARAEKTRRLQNAIADDMPVATSLAILGLLGSQEVGIHGDLRHLNAAEYRVENKPLEAEIDAMVERLHGDRVHGEAVLFRRIVAMPGDDRRALFRRLVARQCGTWPGFDPDLGDTPLAVAVAATLGLEPGKFQMSTAYLERLNREQLARVAREAGVEDVSAMTRGTAIDTIALSPTRDPDWFPVELRFGPKHELMRLLDPNSAGGGVTGRKAA